MKLDLNNPQTKKVAIASISAILVILLVISGTLVYINSTKSRPTVINNTVIPVYSPKDFSGLSRDDLKAELKKIGGFESTYSKYFDESKNTEDAYLSTISDLLDQIDAIHMYADIPREFGMRTTDREVFLNTYTSPKDTFDIGYEGSQRLWDAFDVAQTYLVKAKKDLKDDKKLYSKADSLLLTTLDYGMYWTLKTEDFIKMRWRGFTQNDIDNAKKASNDVNKKLIESIIKEKYPNADASKILTEIEKNTDGYDPTKFLGALYTEISSEAKSVLYEASLKAGQDKAYIKESLNLQYQAFVRFLKNGLTLDDIAKLYVGVNSFADLETGLRKFGAEERGYELEYMEKKFGMKPGEDGMIPFETALTKAPVSKYVDLDQRVKVSGDAESVIKKEISLYSSAPTSFVANTAYASNRGVSIIYVDKNDSTQQLTLVNANTTEDELLSTLIHEKMHWFQMRTNALASEKGLIDSSIQLTGDEEIYSLMAESFIKTSVQIDAEKKTSEEQSAKSEDASEDLYSSVIDAITYGRQVPYAAVKIELMKMFEQTYKTSNKAWILDDATLNKMADQISASTTRLYQDKEIGAFKWNRGALREIQNPIFDPFAYISADIASAMGIKSSEETSAGGDTSEGKTYEDLGNSFDQYFGKNWWNKPEGKKKLAYFMILTRAKGYEGKDYPKYVKEISDAYTAAEADYSKTSKYDDSKIEGKVYAFVQTQAEYK